MPLSLLMIYRCKVDCVTGHDSWKKCFWLYQFSCSHNYFSPPRPTWIAQLISCERAFGLAAELCASRMLLKNRACQLFPIILSLVRTDAALVAVWSWASTLKSLSGAALGWSMSSFRNDKCLFLQIQSFIILSLLPFVKIKYSGVYARV